MTGTDYRQENPVSLFVTYDAPVYTESQSLDAIAFHGEHDSCVPFNADQPDNDSHSINTESRYIVNAEIRSEGHATELAASTLSLGSNNSSQEPDEHLGGRAASNGDAVDVRPAGDTHEVLDNRSSSISQESNAAARIIDDDRPHGVGSTLEIPTDEEPNAGVNDNANSPIAPTLIAPSDSSLGTDAVLSIDIGAQNALQSGAMNDETASDAATIDTFGGRSLSHEHSLEAPPTISLGEAPRRNEDRLRTAAGTYFVPDESENSDVSTLALDDSSPETGRSSHTPHSHRSHETPYETQGVEPGISDTDPKTEPSPSSEAHDVQNSFDHRSEETLAANHVSSSIRRASSNIRSRASDTYPAQYAIRLSSGFSASVNGFAEDHGGVLPYDMIQLPRPESPNPNGSERLRVLASGSNATKSRGTQTDLPIESADGPLLLEQDSNRIAELEQSLEKANADVSKYKTYTTSFHNAKAKLGKERRELKAKISELEAHLHTAAEESRGKDARISEFRFYLKGVCRVIAQMAKAMANETLESDLFRDKALRLNCMLEGNRPVDSEALETIKDKEAIIADLQRDMDRLRCNFDDFEEQAKRREQKDENDLASLQQQLGWQKESTKLVEEQRDLFQSHHEDMVSKLGQISNLGEDKAKTIQEKSQPFQVDNKILRRRITELERQREGFFQIARKDDMVRQGVRDSLQSGLDSTRCELKGTHEKLDAAVWLADVRETTLGDLHEELGNVRQAWQRDLESFSQKQETLATQGVDARFQALLDHKDSLIKGLTGQVTKLQEKRNTLVWQAEENKIVEYGFWNARQLVQDQRDQALKELKQLCAQRNCQCQRPSEPQTAEAEAQSARLRPESRANGPRDAQAIADDAVRRISPAWMGRMGEAKKQRLATPQQVLGCIQGLFGTPAESGEHTTADASGSQAVETLPWAGEGTRQGAPAPWAGESAGPSQHAGPAQGRHAADGDAVDAPPSQAGWPAYAERTRREEDGPQEGFRVPSVSTEGEEAVATGTSARAENAAPSENTESADAPEAGLADDPALSARAAMKRAHARVWQRAEANSSGMSSRLSEMLASDGAGHIPDMPVEEESEEEEL